MRAKNRVGSLMMKAERRILKRLVALDVFDQYLFPHQQLQRDATRMQLACRRTTRRDPVGRPGPGPAYWSDQRRPHFAYVTYAAELERHNPDFDRRCNGVARHTCRRMSMSGISITR